MTQFYTVLTKTGENKIASSVITGTKLKFKHFAVGDSNGVYYEPDRFYTQLKHEVWRGEISKISTKEGNPNWISVEVGIPADVGGFFVREAGIFDEAGDLIAIGKYPETEKPILDSGSAKDLYLRMVLEVGNTEGINMIFDPLVATASKQYVDDIESSIVTQLGSKASITQLNLKANITDMNLKASIIDMDKKSDLAYVNTELAKRATVTQLNTKADTTYTNSELDKKATIIDLNKKADITYTNTELDKKATIALVNTKADTSTMTTELNKKADKTQVLTNVPTGAKFTDTITTVNGNTGVITKADIVALGIPGSFTGYVHPETHPPSIIAQDNSNKFVTLAQINSWTAKQDNLGYVPENIANKSKANGYPTLDSTGRVPKTQLPEDIGEKTPVVKTLAERNAIVSPKKGQECYVTDLGDKYIWSGTAWLTIAKAEWANEVTKWSTITDKPSNFNPSAHTHPVAQVTGLHTVATSGDFRDLSRKPKGGVGTFRGGSLEQTIAHSLGTTPSSATVHPTVNPNGFLGEVWVRFDATNIYVGNTGSFTGALCWTVTP